MLYYGAQAHRVFCPLNFVILFQLYNKKQNWTFFPDNAGKIQSVFAISINIYHSSKKTVVAVVVVQCSSLYKETLNN